MKVKMTAFAKQQICEIAKYIHEEFGKKYSDNFLGKVKKTKRNLVNNPHLGPEEPLLSDLPNHYRSIVVNNLNKMVYYIDDNSTIYIVDFWDVRREPRILSNRI